MLNPLTHRKILKKGMPGRATIVEIGMLDRGSTSFNLPMTLQVHVEGITPYEVEDQWMVKAKDTAGLSGSIPVKVDRGNHDKVAIDWDCVRAEYQQHKAARQEALASGAGGIPGLEGATVNVQGAESMDPEQLNQLLQQLGVAGGAAAQASQAQGAAADPVAHDPVAQLERLDALRKSGALTDEEFEQQKRRILGG
jgi:hypothetical protein